MGIEKLAQIAVTVVVITEPRFTPSTASEKVSASSDFTDS